MLDYIFVVIPAAFVIFLLGLSATVDPIESTVTRVGTAQGYQEIGLGSESMQTLLNSEIEKITYATGSSMHDKRVRVAGVNSGVERLGDAVFSLGEIVDAAQHALGLLTYVVEVDFLTGDGSTLIAHVQFRDAFSGTFVSDERIVVAPGSGMEANDSGRPDDVDIDNAYTLVERVAAHIVTVSEPYLYAAYLYKRAQDDPSRYAEVLDYIDQALPTATPRTAPWFYNLRGLVAKEVGVDAYAVRSYRRALEVDPNFDAAELNLGLLWLDMGDRALARRYFERSIDTHQHLKGVGHLYLAKLSFREGDAEAALQHLNDAEREAPRMAALYDMRADVLQSMGNEAGMRRALRKAEHARQIVPDQERFEPY